MRGLGFGFTKQEIHWVSRSEKLAGQQESMGCKGLVVFGSFNSKSTLSAPGLLLCLTAKIKPQKLPDLGCWLCHLKTADSGHWHWACSASSGQAALVFPTAGMCEPDLKQPKPSDSTPYTLNRSEFERSITMDQRFTLIYRSSQKPLVQILALILPAVGGTSKPCHRTGA